MMKKLLATISVCALLLIGADIPKDTIRLTVINKSKMDIAIQLKSKDVECANSPEIIRGDFYYLTVLEGDRNVPNTKAFDIQRNTYAMQMFYLETYDPVYGFKCKTPSPNALIAQRNIRLVVLPCDFTPGPKAVGEPSMRKYLPFSVKQYALLYQKYWLTRMIY
jgi:hypothetical protein